MDRSVRFSSLVGSAVTGKTCVLHVPGRGQRVLGAGDKGGRQQPPSGQGCAGWEVTTGHSPDLGTLMNPTRFMCGQGTRSVPAQWLLLSSAFAEQHSALSQGAVGRPCGALCSGGASLTLVLGTWLKSCFSRYEFFPEHNLLFSSPRSCSFCCRCPSKGQRF